MRTNRFSLHGLEFSFERNFHCKREWRRTFRLTRRDKSPKTKPVAVKRAAGSWRYLASLVYADGAWLGTQAH